MQYPHKVVILRTSFRYPDRPFSFGRALLYFDRIELTSWSIGDWHTRTIPLSSVRQADWTGEDGRRGSLVLHLDDGVRTALILYRASRWKRLLAQRLSWVSSTRRPLGPDGQLLSLGDVVAYASSFS